MILSVLQHDVAESTPSLIRAITVIYRRGGGGGGGGRGVDGELVGGLF
eukprot:COSAG06_NODE_4733_length_3994_cov_11.077535_1_plen_47_part_10